MIKEFPRTEEYLIPELRAHNYGWKGIGPDQALKYMIDFSDLFGVVGFDPDITYGFCNHNLTQIYSILIGEDLEGTDSSYEVEIRLMEDGFHIIINDREELSTYKEFSEVLGRLQEWLD